MTISGSTKVAGVIGSPIAHSLSPLLMNRWIEAAGLDAAYIALSARASFQPDDFRALHQSGLCGLNITLPLKTLAATVADNCSESVQRTGAANLLRFEDDGISAFNSDIDGLIYAFDAAGVDLSGARVLVLGAGGVARAACEAVRLEGASKIIISNRTHETAVRLAELYPQSHALSWNDRQASAETADIIINATSLGLDGVSSPGLDWDRVRDITVVFDTIYRPACRPFTDFAKQRGLTVIDGLAMFIGQARPSFEVLFGCPAPDEIDADMLLREAL